MNQRQTETSQNKTHALRTRCSGLREHLGRRCALAIGMLTLVATTTLAAPAPWYYWRSISGDRVCAQFTPGPGWTQEGGPFKDARCASRF